MKKHSVKFGVTLFLIAVMVMATVLVSYPVTSQAAAKGTTYLIVMQKPSPQVTYISIAGAAPMAQPSDNQGITFKMVVDAKAKTDKTGTYYPFTILAKSFSAPSARFKMPSGDYAKTSVVMKKDCKGKFFTSGGDVDVSNVMGKKLVTKIGDGTPNGAGSMITDPFSIITITTNEKTGKVFLNVPITCVFTTGKTSIVANGTKTKLDGMTLPNDDKTNTVPTPLEGKPVDLNVGGTMVGCGSTLGVANKEMGTMDFLNASTFVMKITKQ